MFGVLLTTIGSFFEEASTTIGKFEASKHAESLYTMAFLSMFWGALFYIAIGLARHSFVFALASIPTFTTRIVFEIIQTHVSVLAVVKSDRSTFAFVRTLTIPLLLVVDLFLGYSFDRNEIIGMSLIVAVFVILLFNKGIKKDGLFFAVLSASNAVVTISLFKYNIAHYNSVEAEQALSLVILLGYFFAADIMRARENPLKLLLHKVFFAQSAAQGVASVAMGFAYLFAPPSVIVAAGRSSGIMWSVIAGNRIFKEDHIVLKAVLFVLCAAGIVYLAI